MNKIIIVILVSYTSIFSQVYPEFLDAINPDTTFTISINKNVDLIKVVSKIDAFSSEVYGIYNLKIYNPLNNQFIQEIKDTMDGNLMWANIILVDVNVDNYLDITLVKDITDQGYRLFDFWIYDNKSKSFKYNSAYSDLCCNMKIDTTNKEINIGYFNSLEGYSQERTYQITPNLPVLTELSETQDFNSNGIDSVLIKEYNLINGNLNLLKEYKVIKGNGWQ